MSNKDNTKQTQESAVDWSLRTWKERHDRGYFPRSEQHRNWKVYNHVPDWLAEVAGMLPSPSLALEIGCGYGEWMIPLSRLVTHVEGVDIHRNLVHKSRELFTLHNVSNAVVSLSNGITVPHPDSTFDLVYSISVMQHLPREIVHGYMRESMRVLRPQGIVAHHFRDANDVGNYPPLADDIVANHTGDFSCGWTESQILESVEEAGLVGYIMKIPLFLIFVGKKQ